jgi:hypothetical protein
MQSSDDAFESDDLFRAGGIMMKRSGNSWDLGRLNVAAGQGLQQGSNKTTQTDLDKKTSSGASEQSWLGGFVKSDGTQVRLFVRPASRM